MKRKTQKQIAKFLIVFFLLLGVSFSNMSFYVLSSLVDSYLQTRSIVDKTWIVQENSDNDVVDNFNSWRDVYEKLRIHEARAASPTFVACGAASGSASAITPALPTGRATNDILLLFVETAAQAVSVANGNGGTWAEVLNSPQTATTTTRLTVFWSRNNGTQGNPTTSDSGDHQVGSICAYRGIETSGNPWDVTSGSVDTTSDNSGAITGATTTGVDRLVVIVGAANDDADTPITGVSNAGLSSISASRVNAETGLGNDGGLTVFDAVKSSQGAYGTTTLTYTAATTKGMMTIALKPAPPPTITISGTNSTPSADGRTVRVAVNGVLQAQTGSTVAGVWSISGVTPPSTGQVVTVWFDGGADDSVESAAVTKYDGSGDITGMFLSSVAGKVGTGSADNPSMTLADFSYDCADDEDIPYSLVGSTWSNQGCSNSYLAEELNVGDTLTVGAETINTHHLIILAGSTLTLGASAINVSGNFDNRGTFTAGSSTVVMNGTGAIVGTVTGYDFNNLSIGYTGFTTSIAIQSFDVLGTLTFNGGTVDNTYAGGGWMSVQRSVTSTPVVFASPTALTSSSGSRVLVYLSTGTSTMMTIAGADYGTWDIEPYASGSSNTFQLGGNITTTGRVYLIAIDGVTGTIFNSYIGGTNYNITASQLNFGDGVNARTGPLTANLGSSIVTLSATGNGIDVLNAAAYTLNMNSSSVSVAGSVRLLNTAAADTSGTGTGSIALNAGTSTVTLNGIYNQTLSGTMTGANGFNNLIITSSSGTVSGCDASFTPGVTFSSAVDVNGTFTIATTALAAGVYVQYGTGLTYTFNNISWVGTAAKKIYFRNSALGSGTWLLKVTGTQSVSYVDVGRSDASVVGGSAINATDGTNTDCLINTNWNFSAPVTVTATSTGTPTTNFDSGATSQYIGVAFRFQQDTGTAANITALTLTDTGSILFNSAVSEEVANVSLSYKTGDTGTCATGGETTVGNGTLGSGTETVAWSAISIPATVGANYTCLYVRLDAVGTGAVYAPGGSTIDLRIGSSGDFTLSGGSKAGSFPLDPTGATTVQPVITGYTNSTESGLNYAGSCSGCGARIGGGASFRQTVVISGYGFGADPGANSRDTATNKVEVVGVSTNLIDDNAGQSNVTAWSNTSITITTDSAVTGDTDTNWGTNFGGASALKVTAGGQAVPTNLNFYVFPQITSISSVVADAAREHDSGDTDGIITINGTRFGTAATGGYARILGCDSTTCSSPTGTVTAVADGTCDAVDGWANTCIKVQVPTVIANTVYTGAITMQQGTGSNNKTASYSTLRILPRITSLVPSNGIIGAAITVNGDHLCQNGAVCPGSFSAANKVTFTSAVDATVFTSWSDTAIVTAIPTGAVTGNVVVTSNTSYTSNAKSCTVDANTTTIATGSDPSATTIAPGAAATDVDLFTLQTNGGTEAITTVTVNLSTNSGVLRLAITDNANTELGFTASPVSGSNVIGVSGLTASTSVTTFKVRITPLSHGAMPAPDGGAYAITAPVTAWAGGNTHAGSDTNSNALTIDNDSPANVTVSTATAGDAEVVLNWTNPVDSDFHSTVVLRHATTAVSTVPVEGTTYTVGNLISGTDTVACVVATPTATCTDTGLSNGTAYHYKIFTKDSRVNYSVTGVVPTGSPATPTLTQTLTVGTVGTQAVNLDSGSTAQHIGGAGTAAFTLQINTGSSNVTSVKVSEAGSIAMANLTNPKLYYENATNAAACAYGGAELNVSGAAPVGETVTFTLPSVAIGLTANVTCLYFVSDVSSSAAGGQTIELEITDPSTDVTISSGVNSDTVKKSIAGTTTIRPVITGYTNSTESGLDYAASCSGCGARLGGGSGFRQTVVISGYGFGADPGLGSRDTATNKVEIVGASTTVLADDGSANTNVSAWSNTSITIRTDSSIAGNTDTSFGTNFGGASALKVTAGLTAVATNLNFYIFPQVTSITQPGGFPADSAREYDAGDTDGVITLNGTRFGTALGSGYARILGCDSSTCSSPTGSATTDSWSNTAIAVQVPSVIADNVYTGSVVMKQGTGGNSGTNTYLNTFRILPRITDLAPSSALVSDSITVNGNHFCQVGSASCPTGFTNNVDDVTFTTATDATVFTSWSNTAIVTAVPTGAVTGNVVVTSNAYTSNGSLFTLASGVPDDPTNLDQFKDSGFTQQIAVETGVDNTMPLYLKMTMQAPVSGGTLYPQVEYKAIGTPFVCVGTAVCASDAVEGTGVAGPGPTDGSKSISPADGVYHWQARVKHTRNSIDYYSAWVSFGANLETATDFQVDTTPPAVSSVFSGSPGTNGATITWQTAFELATTQVQYNTTGTFVTNCATNNDCTSITDTSPMVNAHSVTLSNLNSGTTYYYRVRSKDAADNETIDANNTFTTQTVSNPAKTVKAYINGATGSVSGATTYYFTVNVPETAPSVTSAYVEVSGLVSGGFSGTVTVQANSATSRAYSVSTAASTPTLYRFLYPINSPNTEVNLNLNNVAPCSNDNTPGLPLQEAGCNKIVITPSTGSINVLSANIIINYSYTP